MRNFLFAVSMTLLASTAIVRSQTDRVDGPITPNVGDKWISSDGRVTTWHQRSYTFEPKDDITAPELAKALGAIMPGLACHNAMSCPDILQSIDALPESAKRHFVLHE